MDLPGTSNQPAVDYGEVIVVENTPPQPPPLPEPPPTSNGFIERNNEDSHRGLHSVTSTDGEKLLFRSMYLVQVHDDDDTIAIMQLVVVLYQDKYKTIQPFHLSTTAPATATNDTATTDTATTTVRRPLSSTVPGSASGYSTTTIDGEWILLCRLAYRVNRLYRVGMELILLCRLAYRVNRLYQAGMELILLCRLAYRVNRLYRVGKILSSIVLLLLQSGSVHDDTTTTMQLVVLYQDKHHTIAITQLVVPYQDKYHTIAVVSSLDRIGEYYYLYNPSNATAPATATIATATIATATIATATTTTTTRVKGQLIGIHDDDDTVATMQVVVAPYQDVHFNDENNYSYRMKLTPTTEDTSYSNTATID
jgi:hypothetical protein